MNPFDLLKNAKGLESEFAKMQEDMKNVRVTGSSGGNIVKVTINGQMEMVSIEIDPIAVDPRDIAMLQDLIVAAHCDAMAKIKDGLQEKLSPMAGMLNMFGQSK
ncbi:MAG: YbaB/EbfC family nucleoid-associated protein [Treponemataceae bacterium]